jgi:protease-4
VPIPLPDDRWGRLPEIHVVYAIGACEMDSGIRGRATSKELQRLAKDRDVKAVVLRADSPGGDPLPSDLVAGGLQAVRRRGKPALVSQGNVAASGGYWISMDGTRILTTPVTITGSIGIIAGWFWDDGLGEKTGFHAEGVQRGTSADLFTGLRFPLLGITIPERNLTPSEQERARKTILLTYDEFVGKVAAARHLTVPDVREVAQGRVWMGGDAIARGLCDSLGTLDGAVEEARRMAGLEGEPVLLVEYPEPPLFRTPRFLPNVPGVGAVARLLFGGGDEVPAASSTLLGDDYEALYLRRMAASPGQPLVLTPPEYVPRGWLEDEDD